MKYDGEANVSEGTAWYFQHAQFIPMVGVGGRGAY